MATQKGHRLDSFITEAYGPSLTGAFQPPLASHYCRIIIGTFTSYLSLPEQFAITRAVCHYNTSNANNGLKLKQSAIATPPK